MKDAFQKLKDLFFLVSFLPFIYGCQGGGDSSFLSSLFGGGAGSAGSISGGGSSIVGGGGSGLETIHNPEPASMVLLGSGLMAMAFYNKRKK